MSKHKFEIPKNKEDAKKRIEELKKKFAIIIENII